MKYSPPPRRHSVDPRPASERRTKPRDLREIWTPSMREDFRMQEFLSGVQVHDIDWTEWQDTATAFRHH